ncbi:MAG: hypothetical protein ILP10_04520 [Lachnospiraceae bacterium]|nr:hypothetical protein [Lachnospiraceae bacterium]
MEEEFVLAGGFSNAKSPVITKARMKLFNKAFRKFTGSTVVPVAYLGKQVVAGVNHLYLCRSKAVVPGATEYYCLVTIYKDLKGKVSILDMIDTEVETMISGEDGGWFMPKSIKLTKTVKKAFNKALRGLNGVSYKPVALISKQITEGTGYSVLCRSKGVFPGATSGYSIVIINRDLDGKAELRDIMKLSDNEASFPLEPDPYYPDHSMNTVIVTAAEGVAKERMEEIFTENSLTIRYDYDFINAYAVSLAEDVDEATLTALIEKLESYDEILTVGRDWYYHTCLVNDPVI